MSKVIIFGTRDFATLAYHYLVEEGLHEIAGFSVSRSYFPDASELYGLPVVPFEEVEETYPPGRYHFFAPMSHRNLNRDRESIFEAILQKGYEFISYIHPSSIVASNVDIGKNCMILESNTLQPFVSVSDNVVIWGGNFISHHATISRSVFISCNTTIGGHCHIGERSFLGNNCVIRDQLEIAHDSKIGMGANVLKTTEAGGTYIGNPAKPIQ